MLLGSTVWGLCKLLLFMYPCIYQTVLSKVSQETLPFLLQLGSSFSQLQLLPYPSFLCRLESFAGRGSSGWWRGIGAMQYLQPHLHLGSRQEALKS